MPDALYVLPDSVLALIQYYRARPEIAALLPASTSIEATLPAGWAGTAFVLVNLAGSGGIWPAVGDDAIQVDCYAPTKDAASALARTVRAATWAIRNDTVAAGTLMRGLEEIGPQWLPDSLPTIPVDRFTARYRIIFTP